MKKLQENKNEVRMKIRAFYFVKILEKQGSEMRDILKSGIILIRD